MPFNVNGNLFSEINLITGYKAPKSKCESDSAKNCLQKWVIFSRCCGDY